MPVRTIQHGSAEYSAMLALRERVLRTPLGLPLSKEDIQGEEEQILIASFSDDRLVGSILLKPTSQTELLMRQVSVAPEMQGKGVGTAMLAFAESEAKRRGYTKIQLNGRVSAQKWYEANGYTTVSEPFPRLGGILHVRMMKQIEI